MARKNTDDRGQGGRNAREMNASVKGNRDVVNIAGPAGKPNDGGKGSVSRVIGPMTATTKISGGGSLVRGTVGPSGAPYHDKAR